MNTKTAAGIIRYLKDRGIRESFEQNTVKFRGRPAGSERRYVAAYTHRMLTLEARQDVVKCAFPWYRTPEGEDFWRAEDEAYLKWFNA